ncbi:rod shape-determining protein MreC [Angustibacter peucedani]
MRRSPRRSGAVLAPLVVLTVLLLLLDVAAGRGGPTDRVRGIAAAVLGPAERAASTVGRSLQDAANGLTGRTRGQLDDLRRENDALRLADRAHEDDRRRAEELDGLLRTAGLGRYEVVPARVVAASSEQDARREVTLDAGSRDGIRAEMTVLSGQGLVGRVVRVAPTTCDVLLVTDPSFSVGVRLEASGLIGVATGGGDDPMSLKLLDAQTRVATGARLVTLGSANGTPFVPGVPVGEVRDVRTAPGTLSRTGSVAPYVTPSTVDLVGVVVQPPRRDPRDAVLPPVPRATP